MTEPTPIPEPKPLLARAVQCPDCPRTFRRRELARYALHWRLVHGADPVQPRPEEAPDGR